MGKVITVIAALLCVTCANADEYAGKQTGGAAPRYTFSWPLDANTSSPRWHDQRTASHFGSRAVQRMEAIARHGTVTPGTRSSRDPGNGGHLSRDVRFFGSRAIRRPGQTDGAVSVVGHGKSLRRQRRRQDHQPGAHPGDAHPAKDGSISEPMVTKHWRQDWQYEPTYIDRVSRPRSLATSQAYAAEAKGMWLQSVYQVDESPRYASIGRWQHSASFSTWLSGDTWRPLPRREWSVRDDYQVLIGTNRHTISATGWIQEENNLKAVLTDARAVDASRPFVAREYGVARYERIRDAEFARPIDTSARPNNSGTRCAMSGRVFSSRKARSR